MYIENGLLNHGLCDSDQVGDTASWKSIPKFCFNLGTRRLCFHRKHGIVVVNLVEAEYIETCSTTCEVVCFIH
jgi:hypothetical protein